MRIGAITPDLRGDYVNDKQFKRQFQLWLNGVWQEKDRHLAAMRGEMAPAAAVNVDRAARPIIR